MRVLVAFTGTFRTWLCLLLHAQPCTLKALFSRAPICSGFYSVAGSHGHLPWAPLTGCQETWWVSFYGEPLVQLAGTGGMWAVHCAPIYLSLLIWPLRTPGPQPHQPLFPEIWEAGCVFSWTPASHLSLHILLVQAMSLQTAKVTTGHQFLFQKHLQIARKFLGGAYVVKCLVLLLAPLLLPTGPLW